MAVAVQRLSGLLTRRVGTPGHTAPLSPEQALAAGAQIYLNFISLTQDLQSNRAALKTGAQRYQNFLTLTGSIATRTEYTVPTRDISLIWAAQMLQPQHYQINDAQTWYHHQQFRLLQNGKLHPTEKRRFTLPGAMLGALVGGAISKNPVGAVVGAAVLGSKKETGFEASSELKAFDTNDDGLLSPEERKAALSAWEANYARTAQEWRITFNEDYRLSVHQLQQKAPCVLKESLLPLVSAAQRQASFNRRILKLGPKVITPQWIHTAVMRYMQFLELAKEKPGTLLVPTLDVDLIWHAHMLSPEDYREDCHAVLGRLLKHDDNVPEGKLEEAFERTKELWKARFGNDYVQSLRDRKAQQKTSSSSSGGSGCASCGWGDAQWHQHHEHNFIEDQMVAEAGGGDGNSQSAGDVGWGDRGDDVSSDSPWSTCGYSGDSGGGDCGGGD